MKIYLIFVCICTILYFVNIEATDRCGRNWATIQPVSGPRPRNISAHTMVTMENKFFIFGGFYEGFGNGIYSWNNNLWSYNFNSREWRLLTSGNKGPSVRGFHGAVSDECESKMYVYGGVTYPPDFSNITVYGDFWSYDVDGANWKKISTSVNPGPRGDFGLAQLNGKIYLFGGVTDNSFTVVNDLWVFDPENPNKWNLLIANGAAGNPPARNTMQFRASEGDNKLYMYGGEDPLSGFGSFTDTWSYNPRTNKWTNITPPEANNLIPQVNNHQASTFIGSQFLIFGGETPGSTDGCGSPFPQNPSNNFWSMDVSDSPKIWKKITTSNVTPPKVKRHAGDDIGQCFCYYGGWDFACPPGQTWNNDLWCIRKPNY